MIPVLPISGSDLAISRLGFGCARILGGREAGTTRQLIETALNAGIRHFDTAPFYGEGASEALLGAMLAGVADATVTTKVGLPRPVPAGRPSLARQLYRQHVRRSLAAMPRVKRLLTSLARPQPATTSGPRRPLTREMIERSLAESEALLRRRVDILLIHEPDQLDLDDGVSEVLAAMQRAGRIGAFGCGADAVAPAGWRMGTVRQQRYGALIDDGATAIFHGVLRGHAGSAAARMTRAMAADPAAVFLFSASTPAQIRQLAAMIDIAN